MFVIIEFLIVVAALVLLQGCAYWDEMGDQEKATRKFLAPGTLGLSLIVPSNNAKNTCETPHCQVEGTLPWVAEVGDTDIIEKLLANGADVNEKDALGRAPLRLATQNKRYNAVVMLLAADPSQNEKDNALRIASEMGLSGMVKILLEYDASPNAFVDNQNTAFMTAAEYNNWQIIEILLNAGADVTLRNSGGRTAIHYAKGCEKCLEILRRK